MFTLRYRHEVPLHLRKHGPTTLRFHTHAEAEAYRTDLDNGHLLEVVER